MLTPLQKPSACTLYQKTNIYTNNRGVYCGRQLHKQMKQLKIIAGLRFWDGTGNKAVYQISVTAIITLPP